MRHVDINRRDCCGVTHASAGWYNGDPLISAAWPFYPAAHWLLLRDAVGTLLEVTPKDINVADLRDALASVSRRFIDSICTRLVLHVWNQRHQCSRSLTTMTHTTKVIVPIQKKRRVNFEISHTPYKWSVRVTLRMRRIHSESIVFG